MNIAIISFSYSGNNEALAKSVANKLNARHIKIATTKPVNMGRLILDMMFGITPKVKPNPEIVQQYDLVLFFSPVWMGMTASPLRAYLNYLRHNPIRYGFLSISGGADGGNTKLEKELRKRTGKEPCIVLDQHISETLQSKAQITRKDTSEYKLSQTDVEKLAKYTLVEINKIL